MICAVHCIALPILLAVLPVLGLGFLLNETLEKGFVIASVAVAGFSLFWGVRVHGRWRAIPLYVLGALMLVLGMFVFSHGHDHAQDHVHGLLLLVLGATAMSASHIINRRLCLACPKCHGDCN